MSKKAIAWVKSLQVANSNQRELLLLMAGMADDEGNVSLDVPIKKLIGTGNIDTERKLNRALSLSESSGYLSKMYSFDDYLYHWKLAVL